MTSTSFLSRRAVLAGAGACTVLPGTASLATPHDPVFDVYSRWRHAFDFYGRALGKANAYRANSPQYDAAIDRANAIEGEAEWRAMGALVDTVPASLSGLSLQLSFAEEIDLWHFGNWQDDLDRRLFNSIRAGVAKPNMLLDILS